MASFVRALLFLCLWDLSRGEIVYSVSEEVAAGTAVGNVAKDLNLGVPELETRAFRIVRGATKRRFDVNLKTGALFVTDRIDREEMCPRTPRCSVVLEAMAHDPMRLYRFEIDIVDINDNPPVFPVDSITLDIIENVLPGDRFSLPPAEDPDVGANSVQTYKLGASDHFALDAQGGSVELVLQKHLDRETVSKIRLTLTALDGGKPPKSATLAVAVNVLDINDNNPVFSKPLYKFQVRENTRPGTKIGTLSASDADEGVNGQVVYSFVGHDRPGALDSFSIDPQTGDVSVGGEIDYEERAGFELRAQARDNGHSPRRTSCKVLVEVTDENDNRPEISATLLARDLSEDVQPGAAFALITVSDRDGGANGKVACRITEGLPFQLQSSYKNSYSLVVLGPLDRETVSAYNITVIATDEGSPPLTSSSVVTVRVSDVNDNAPRFPGAAVQVYVKENSPAGAHVATVTAHDLDVGENARVSYALVGRSGGGSPASAMVNINSITGEMFSLQTFNYEEVKQLSFVVQATDSGVPPLSSNVTVNVFILDENDNSPVVLPPYSEHGSVNAENIPYSAEAGYFVAKIRAVDGDSGYNALLSYHISEPKSTNLFRIGSSTGEVRTKRRMSDNDLRSHPLVIVVCDHGEPPLSATVSIDVVVSEMIDDAETTFRQAPVQEKNFSDLNLYLLVAIIAVSLLFLLSLISLLAVKCYKAAGSFSKYSTPVITSHPDGTWSYSKSTQQYDVCFSSDTLKSDVVVLPPSFPPADADLISINGGDTFNQTQTLPNTVKDSDGAVVA
ncbi:LOW QUALITY PROTEIN: protocadherin alpha-13-like [Denticeps clupeoides]|uniref:LOW QUALITY PROTEIN: protocadherin alpha-13-like n=1 Tax=Denticeps clupeoides TaxID=299321 RepID=UPI0010A4399E|nr:LOW QUALITY PROTEIN: protocadherin alpha-13-like [Denticeps clupeoides]